MSHSNLRWRPKRRKNNKQNTINTIINHQYENKRTYNKRVNNQISWIPHTDLRLQRIKEFVTFFTSSYHKQQEIENGVVYIEQLLTKLDKNDISILLNYPNKYTLINDLESFDIIKINFGMVIF